MEHFVYLWFDVSRRMFYVGSHSGTLTDGYVSSSRWLNGEQRYRPSDFKRRVICRCASKNEAQRIEGRLLASIDDKDFGVKYYNMKIGKPRGSTPWNKGRTGVYSDETRERQSRAKLGHKFNVGRKNPKSATNGKVGASKLSEVATGRRKVIRDGRATWAYPTDTDYPN